MTITLLWYHVPTFLSVLAVALAIWWPTRQTDYGVFAGLSLILRLCVAMAFIGFVWIVTAVMK